MEKKKFFYGWWIMLTMFMSMTFFFAPIVNLLSLFTDPVSTDLGVSRTDFTFYYTIVTLTGMISAPFAGRILQKVDARVYLTVLTLFGIASFIGFSMAQSIWVFYALGVLQGIALVAGSVIPASVLITNWFVEKRGLALGIALAGSGVGGVLLSPVIAMCLHAVGWRGTYLVLAAIVAITVLPFTIFIVRFKPSEKGMVALGEQANAAQAQAQAPAPGLTQKQAMSTPAFWVLSIAILLTGIVVNTMLVNLTPYLSDLGVTVAIASLVLAIGSGTVIAGKLICGRLFDLMNTRVVLIILGVCNLLSFVSLIFASSLTFGILYSLFTAMGACALTIAPTYVASVLFGRRDFSGIFGVLSMFTSVGTAIAAVFGGLLLNATGSWNIVLYALMALAIISMVLYLVALSLKPKWETEA